MSSNYVWLKCESCKEFSLTPDLKWHEDTCRQKDYGKLRLNLELFDKNLEDNFYNSQKSSFLWLSDKTLSDFNIGKYLLVYYAENLYSEEHFENFEASSVVAQVLTDRRINRNAVVFNSHLASLLKCQIEKNPLRNNSERLKTPEPIDKKSSPLPTSIQSPSEDKKSSSKKKKTKNKTPNKFLNESFTKTDRQRVKVQIIDDNAIEEYGKATIELNIIKPKTLHIEHTQQLTSLLKHHCEGSLLRQGLIIPLLFLMEELLLEVMCVYGGDDAIRVPGHKWVEVNENTHIIVKNTINTNGNKIKNNSNNINNNSNNNINNESNNGETTISNKYSNIEKVKEMTQIQKCPMIGYADEKKQLVKLLELSATLSRPIGVLINGPSGSGKSRLADYLCQSHDIHHINKDDPLACSHIHKRAYTYISLMQLYNILQEEEIEIPMKSCIIILDSLDLITSHSSPHHDNTKLHRLIDSLFNHNGPRLVVATVTNANNIPPEFTLATRFSMLIDLKPCTKEERFEILKHLLQGRYEGGDEMKVITDSCHAFLPQDLVLMVQIAELNYGLRAPEERRQMIECLREAHRVMKKRCRLMKKDYAPVQAVTWQDIVGYDDVKKQLQRMLYLPLTLHKYSSHPTNHTQRKDNEYSSSFESTNQEQAGSHMLASFKAPKGILLYGPPGCSKTMIAKALATESKLNFIAAKSVDLISKYVGESEKNIRNLFRRARSAQPCVLFFDEVDSIACNRERSNNTSPLLTTILTELDGVVALEGVFVVAATNAPFHIDASLLRPGRLGQCVYIPLPDTHTRHLLLSRLLSGLPVHNDVNVASIVQLTDMFSGSELVKLVTQTSNLSLLDDVQNPVLKPHHFNKALSRIVPASNQEMIDMYLRFSKRK